MISVRPGHVGLNVTHLARSRDFYTRVLDLHTLGTGSDPGREWAFLGRDGAVLLTLWRQAAGQFDPGRPGLHHLALYVERPDELVSVAKRLAELGVRPRQGGPVLHAEGADSGGLYFSDPDGIRLEVSVSSGLAGTGAAVPEDGPACGHF